MKQIVLVTAILLFGSTPAFSQDLLQDSFETVAITNFRASPDAILAEGSTTINWFTAFAASCIPSGGTGGWDALNIDLPGGSAQINISATGSYTFILDCVGVDGSVTSAEEVVTVSNPVKITSFNAVPVSFEEGGSTTVSWTTAFANSCTPSGGAGDWGSVIPGLPNGEALINIATAGIYTFSLACEGDANSSADTFVKVTVTQPVAINSFSAVPDALLEGGTTTISWDTSGATSCTPSGGTAEWQALSIGLPIGSAQVAIATAGGYTFTLDCQGAESSTASQNALVTVSQPVTINSFSASPEALLEGGTTTISWNTSGATACAPSEGTADWRAKIIALPNGTAEVTIASVGIYTFTLSCQGAGDSTAAASTVVTVSKQVGSCDPAPLLGTTELWVDFWGVEFPGPAYDQLHAVIPRSGYRAFEFNTGSVVDWGLLEALNTTLTQGVRTGSISECPGDFNVAPECRHSWGTGTGIGWTTNGLTGGCALKPGTTYFFNVTFTNGVDPKTSTCDSQSADRLCRAFLQHSNF